MIEFLSLLKRGERFALHPLKKRLRCLFQCVGNGLLQSHGPSLRPGSVKAILAQVSTGLSYLAVVLLTLTGLEGSANLLPQRLRSAPQPCRALCLLLHGSQSRKCLQRTRNALLLP